MLNENGMGSPIVASKKLAAVRRKSPKITTMQHSQP